MTADSSFFKTMGVTVFTGDPNELNNPDVLFISRSLAKEMFASQDPVGKTVVYNKQMPMTVKGVYEDFPEFFFVSVADCYVYGNSSQI